MQSGYMKKLGARFYLILTTIIWTAISVLRGVLELIGYATIADDAKEAHGILNVLADMALALPWWAIWWPLFISYICAAGIAFDFSFDLFKRPKRTKGKAGKYLDRIESYYVAIKPYRYQNSGIFTPTGKLAAMAEIKMLWADLEGYGFELNPLRDDDVMLDQINDIHDQILGDLKTIKAYLKRGEIDKAKGID